MKRLHKNCLIAVLLNVLLLSACSEQVSYVIKEPLVKVYKIPEQPIHNFQKFPAIIQASDLTNLSFRVNGELTQISALSGQKVNQGQVLARLDPTSYELAVKDKKARLDLALVQKERAEKLVKLGSLAKSTYDELEAQYRIAKAEHQLALQNLKYTVLKAPFEGVIADVPADNFQNIATGEYILSMYRGDKVEVKIELPDVIFAAAEDKDVDSSEVELNVMLDAYPDTVFKAKYKEHTALQSEENKTFLLILEMPVVQEKLALQGMPGGVELDLASLNFKKTIINSVPVEAISLPDHINVQGNKSIVWRLTEGGEVESVEVESQGLDSHSHMEVVGPLNPGDLIVYKGLSYLKDGLKVNVYQQEEASE